MQRQKYSVVNNKETLVYDEIYDENNNLVQYTDYQARPISKKKFEYDNKNRLTKEIEISDGIELQRLEMIFSDEGEIVEQNLYFSGDLFESVKTESTENGFVRTTYQDGEEVYRIESIKDNN